MPTKPRIAKTTLYHGAGSRSRSLSDDAAELLRGGGDTALKNLSDDRFFKGVDEDSAAYSLECYHPHFLGTVCTLSLHSSDLQQASARRFVFELTWVPGLSSALHSIARAYSIFDSIQPPQPFSISNSVTILHRESTTNTIRVSPQEHTAGAQCPPTVSSDSPFVAKESQQHYSLELLDPTAPQRLSESLGLLKSIHTALFLLRG